MVHLKRDFQALVDRGGEAEAIWSWGLAEIDRLFALYKEDRGEGESARSWFGRVELSRVKAALADLETLPPESAQPEDFVDLGDAGEFKVETQAGECSA